MSKHIVTATEASRTFSSILNKVHYLGESYEIRRGKEVIACIVPAKPNREVLKVAELNAIFEHLPTLDEKDKEAFANDIESIRHQMNNEDRSKLWD